MFLSIILTEKENTREKSAKIQDTLFHLENKQKQNKTKRNTKPPLPSKNTVYEAVSSMRNHLVLRRSRRSLHFKLYCLVHKNRSIAPVRGTEYHNKSPIPLLWAQLKYQLPI
jgi:hypothetical protein